MNTDVVARDRKHLEALIEEAIDRHGSQCDLNHIDVSNIENFGALFKLFPTFNGDISKWNVGSATSMEGMFSSCSFNGDISKWDVSRVQSMKYMFFSSKFNRDLSNWDVSNVVNMAGTFEQSIFNGDISRWNTGSVRMMYSMFTNALFNGDISNWDVSQAQTMEYMFSSSKFTGNISKWNVRNAMNLTGMFLDCPFQGDLSAWVWDNRAIIKHMLPYPKEVPVCLFHWQSSFAQGSSHYLSDKQDAFFECHRAIAESLHSTDMERGLMLHRMWLQHTNPTIVTTLSLPELNP